MNVKITSSSVGFIDTIIHYGDWKLRFTSFYGNPITEKRGDSWDLFARLTHFSNFPWIIGGDFNEILFAEEKRGGAAKREAQMQGFRDVINECMLFDLGFKGDRFTWRKNKKGEIQERLDRYFANSLMINSVHSLKVHHQNYHSSDHHPIVLNVEKIERRTNYFYIKKKGFRFEESWTNFEEAKSIILKFWKEPTDLNEGDFCKKVQKCTKRLFYWNKRRLKGSLSEAIKRKENELESLSKCRSEDLRDRMVKVEVELDKLIEEEEQYWRIRS